MSLRRFSQFSLATVTALLLLRTTLPAASENPNRQNDVRSDSTPRIYVLESEYSSRLFWLRDWGDHKRFYTQPVCEMLKRLPPTYARLVRKVSDKDIESGVLSQSPTGVLFLPNTLSLGTKECRAIDDFVKGGGLLIADGAPGRHNPNAYGFQWRMSDGRPLLGLRCIGVRLDIPTNLNQPSPAGSCWNLELTERGSTSALFTGPFELPEDFVLGDVPANRVLVLKNGHSSDDPDNPLDDVEIVPITPVDERMTLATWRDVARKIRDDAAGQDRRIQAVIANKYGKGRVVYFTGKIASGYRYCNEKWGATSEPCRNTVRIMWNALRMHLDLPIPQKEKLAWFLCSQMRPRHLIASYDAGGRLRQDNHDADKQIRATTDMAAVYDQALAIFAFLILGEKTHAQEVRRGLQDIQGENGAFPFSVSASDPGEPPYAPREIVGANSFCVLALSHLAEQTNDQAALAMAQRTADWLCEMQDEKVLALPMDRKRPSVFSTENNLDAAAALTYLAGILRETDQERSARYSTVAAGIDQWLSKMWMENAGCFARGWNAETSQRDEYAVLDCTAWALLALHDRLLTPDQEIRLLTSMGQFQSTSPVNDQENAIGFDFNSDGDTVWYEGTCSAICAYRLAGDQVTARQYLTDARRVYKHFPHGGLPYATRPGTEDESSERCATWPSVASTCWFLFAETEFNPFQPQDAQSRPEREAGELVTEVKR